MGFSLFVKLLSLLCLSLDPLLNELLVFLSLLRVGDYESLAEINLFSLELFSDYRWRKHDVSLGVPIIGVDDFLDLSFLHALKIPCHARFDNR